jgi:hypothetical protein
LAVLVAVFRIVVDEHHHIGRVIVRGLREVQFAEVIRELYEIASDMGIGLTRQADRVVPRDMSGNSFIIDTDYTVAVIIEVKMSVADSFSVEAFIESHPFRSFG